MPTLSASSHTIPTNAHLYNVHRQLMARYAITRNKKAQIAKEIEYYLNLIKNGQGQDPIWGRIREMTALMLNVRTNNLFHTFEKDAKALGFSNSGEAFEKEFAQMIDAMMKEYAKSLGESISKGYLQQDFTIDIMTGKVKGNVQTRDGKTMADMIDLNKFDQVAKEHNIFLRDKKGNILYDKYGNVRYKNLASAEAKDIKTDVRGKNLAHLTLNIDWNTTNEFERFLKILTNYSFSLKNYDARTEWWEKIDLGDTNTFKAYAGVLSDLGYSAEVIENSFWRAYGCYNARHSHGVAEHMGHIQSIYELIGLGLVFANNQKERVDFLIINAKDAKSIFVQSTDAVAWDVLNDISNTSIGKRNVFGGGSVSISGSSLGTVIR